MDDATRTKEQQGFKEGVCEEVEHRRAVGRHARREEHVTELRAGRISDHALNIVLREPDRRRKEGRRCTHNGNNHQGRFRKFKHWRKTTDHEDTGRDHCRRMDQRRDRCRTFHRVRQPGVQTQLCRFAHRPHEEQQTNDRHRMEFIA